MRMRFYVPDGPAYKQDPQRVDRWLGREFPAIRAEAKRLGAEIWFGDEAAVRSDAHAGKTWAPRGKTPIVSSTGARFGLNLISAVNRQGAFRFMCVCGRLNADVFITFLKRLMHNSPRMLFLIVDAHPTHRALKVKRFLETVSTQLRLFFLPPYSPELHPDEHVWNDLKNNALERMAISGPDQMKDVVISHLRCLQKSPALIRSFFLTLYIRHAA